MSHLTLWVIIVSTLLTLILSSYGVIENWFDKKRLINRNKKLLADVSSMNICDKQMPKFINKLNEGDKLFGFYTAHFKRELKKNLLNNVSIVDSIAPYKLRCFTVKNVTSAFYECVDEIDGYETDIFKPLQDIFVIEHSNNSSNEIILSASLEMLLIYLKKMEKDTRLKVIERMKMNEKRCSEDDVNKWLDSLKSTNLNIN